jgi:hypothetical protein
MSSHRADWMSVVLAAHVGQRARAGGHRSAIWQWVRGLRDLGHEVTFVDADRDDALDLGRRACRRAELVLNVMGALPRALVGGDAMWAFVDIDPGYPQMWHELGLADMFAGHDRFVTVGLNIGREECSIPTCDLDWITTPPPIALEEWPVAGAPGARFTTVATWRNPYGTVEFDGVTYGSRVHEFRRFIDLPALLDVEFELALDIDEAEVSDASALRRSGWALVDPHTVAATPETYRRFIQRSRAEICVAQNMYVRTRGGWLSDRSLCYLASGRPVLAQDTGFSEECPVGEGLLSFATLAEAAAGVLEIEADYQRHSRAARALAEEYFDAELVLSDLLDRLSPSQVRAR